MTTATAALCHGHGKAFTFEQVQLADLRPDELRVRIVACGICHTDLAVRDGQLPVGLPAILGHEGAGVVEAVGADVTHIAPGDRVVMSFNSCGQCPNCADHAPTYCYDFFAHNWSGARADGTATVRGDGGAQVNANFFGQSAFATHAIATVRNVVKVPESAAAVPLTILAPIGCGLMTGAGAVLRSMKVRADLPIAVFGAGTVGMAAIMAAKIAGAHPIIAVDVNDDRLALARELGATHAFNARAGAIDSIRALCTQGLGYVFDTTGINAVIQDAWNLLAPRGIAGIVGASDPADLLTFNEAAFMGGGRRVMGILGGDSDGEGFLTELIEHHLAGRFPYERLIEVFPFNQIEQAIAASESGKVVKPVLSIGQE
ncbi:NAD(P)-dependent alcohol dehydrogenase [Novosphingobium sp. SL115]|uniref:NAD(P)-dependent alcohol dehydrogenase n=1 Tax=Novosphingobium sp. SL115 TaxID=2995150 RepID=UPI002274FA96|nr:NAD(P)-dependent alcohol dehydrogenase [Novosphingobium sp. SL115]MCY1671709.1 NAD(P)-dependent alcohol dehydrogenase [Novosphingobium sp. SL115]